MLLQLLQAIEAQNMWELGSLNIIVILMNYVCAFVGLQSSN